ncbi:hypothetical protein [Rhizobium sp.]
MGQRGPKCTICDHRERAAIDLGLARGVSIAALSQRYGVGTDALRRHGKNHLPPQLRAKLIAGPAIELDLDRLRETESQSLLANLVAVRQRLFASLDAAEEHGDSHMVGRVVSQIHKNLELTGKLLGDLGVGTTNVTNVLVSPVYMEMRVGLVNALADYPDARIAVAAVLQQIEAREAKTIEATEYAR